MSPVFVTTPFLVQKALKTANSEKCVFFVSDVESGARASKFARLLPKTGSTRLPCSEFRFLPRKACEFQPAELVAACHRFVTARFLGAKVRKTGPSSRAPSPQGLSRPDSPPRTRLNVRQPAEVVRQPAELVTTDVTAPSGSVFWCKKRSKRSSPKSPFFVSDMPKPPNSQVFGGKRAPDAERVTACHRFVTALFGAEKCAMEKRVCVVAREFELRDIFPRSINLETPRVCKTWLILPVVICLSQSRS